MPVDARALGAGAAEAGVAMIPAAIAAIPGRMERNYRRYLASEQQRLARGGGGMTASQRASMAAQGRGEVEAQREAQMAAVARGSAQGVQSGAQQAAMAGAQRIAQQGAAQVDSAVRGADLQLASAQRQQILGGMQRAAAMGAARKAAFLAEMGGSGLTRQAGQAAGQAIRIKRAGEVEDATTQATG